MSYINDPREMAIRPESGVTLEQDNRIETMYHWGAMVTDLCDLPVSEYMKPMTVIVLGSGEGQWPSPDTGTTPSTVEEVKIWLTVLKNGNEISDEVVLGAGESGTTVWTARWQWTGSFPNTIQVAAIIVTDKGEHLVSMNLKDNEDKKAEKEIIEANNDGSEILQSYKSYGVGSVDAPVESVTNSTYEEKIDNTNYKYEISTEESIIYLSLKVNISGSIVYSNDEMKYGQVIDLSTIETEKEGYTFIGWFDEKGVEFKNGDKMPAKDLNLIGKYEAKKCIVTFVFDYGTGVIEEVSSATVSYGTKVSKFPSTSKTGYKFLNWEPATSTVVTDDITFTAKFEPIEYTITWSGYSDGVRTEVKYYGDVIEEPEEIPYKEGYSFNGWDKTFPLTVKGNIKITANFTINKYRIDYFIMINGDEGEPVSSMTLNYNSTITAKKIPSLTGYTFTEWVGYNADTNEPFDGAKMPAFNVKYVSTRTPNTYYLSYYDNGEHIITHDYEYKELIIPYTYEKIGWTVSKWDNLPETMPYHNVSAHCTSTINQYEVIFKTNDDEVINIAYPDYGTPIVDILPKIEGKTYVVSDDVLKGTVLAEDMVIYGDLIVNDYEVTFIVNGNEEKVVKLPYESSVDNYVVDNFIPGEGYSMEYSPKNIIVPANNDLVVNITYVLNKWTLTYETFGGDDNDISGEMKVEYGTKILSVLPETTIEGYNFDGWFDDDVKIDENTTMPDNDLYVHGNYNVITYIVVVKDGDFNFEKEYRHGTLLSEVLSEKEIVEHIEALSAVGYTGIFKLNGEDVDNSMEIKSNLEIQIERIPNEYVLTFTNGGNVISSALTPFDSDIVYPEMSGYTENGVEYIFIWDDNSYNGGKMPNRNLTINGKYQEKAEAPIYFGSYVIPTSAYSDDNISKYYDESQLNTPYYDSIMAEECVGNGSLIIIFMPGYEPFANLSDRNAVKEAKNYYQPPVFIVPINVVEKYNINVIDGVGGDQWPNFITDKATLTINGNDYYFYSRIPNDTLTPGKYDNSDLKVTLKLTEK